MSTSHTTLKAVEKAILQFIDGTQIFNPRFFYKVYEGYGFAASKTFKNVAAGADKQILFRNPVGSGRQVDIIAIEVVGLAQLYAEIYVGNTVTAVGTTVTPLNLRPSTGISSVAQVAYDGTYTLGTLIYDMVCPGGSRNFAVGGALALGEAVMLDENVNFVLKIINASASATDFSARAVWWEDPV
jgi:hypothetical protein